MLLRKNCHPESRLGRDEGSAVLKSGCFARSGGLSMTINFLACRQRRLTFSSLLVLSLLAPAAKAQAPPATGGALHIVVQKREGKSIRLMPEKHVFQRGDQVRLRVRSDSDGYLYVLNRSSSGKIALLFPAGEAQPMNRIERDHEYTLPATSQHWFTIEDPPGYETLYFLVSTQPTGTAPALIPPLVKPPAPQKAPANGDVLLPRCDDDLFRARGDCLDLSAGPQAVVASDPLPGAMNSVSNMASRDINVTEEGDTVTVSPRKGSGPAVVYEFRIAHR